MRKPIGLVVPIQIETPEETEVFSVMEQSSVRKEAIRNRVLSDRVTELEAKYETSTN